MDTGKGNERLTFVVGHTVERLLPRHPEMMISSHFWFSVQRSFTCPLHMCPLLYPHLSPLPPLSALCSSRAKSRIMFLIIYLCGFCLTYPPHTPERNSLLPTFLSSSFANRLLGILHDQAKALMESVKSSQVEWVIPFPYASTILYIMSVIASSCYNYSFSFFMGYVLIIVVAPEFPLFLAHERTFKINVCWWTTKWFWSQKFCFRWPDLEKYLRICFLNYPLSTSTKVLA